VRTGERHYARFVRWILAAIAVAAALTVGACGGSGDESVKLEVATPKPRAHANGNVVTLAGTAADGAEVKIAVKGGSRSPRWPSRNRWTYALKLKPGTNVVRVKATKPGYRPATVALKLQGPAIQRPGVKPVSAGVPNAGRPRRPPVKRGATRFSPRQGVAYQAAQTFCYENGEQRLARRYHTAKHAFDIAKAYSGTRPQWARQAVFEGCLSGFGDRG
jgi:hypothetical protein